MVRNYLLLLNALLKKRKWNRPLIWKMLELIALELNGDSKSDTPEKSFLAFKEIYKYAVKCESYTELEEFLDKYNCVEHLQ